MRKISYCDALKEATVSEMERDPSVFVYGIGVPDHKKIFGTTKRLQETFGKDRCFDTPLSEDSLTGFALGAAINNNLFTIIKRIMVSTATCNTQAIATPTKP